MERARRFGILARGAKRRVERMRRAGDFLIVESQVRAEDFLEGGFLRETEIRKLQISNLCIRPYLLI